MQSKNILIGLFVLAVLLIGGFFAFSYSVVSQSQIKVKDGQNYTLTSVILDKEQESLELLRKGNLLEGFLVNNTVSIQYGGVENYYEMPMSAGTSISCNDLAGRKDLGYTVYYPTSEAKFTAKGNIKVLQNGLVKSEKNFDIDTSDRTIDLGDGVFAEIQSLALKNPIGYPSANEIVVMVDRNDNNRVYVTTKDELNAKLKEINFFNTLVRLTPNANPLLLITSGNLLCPAGLGYNEMKTALKNTQPSIDKYNSDRQSFIQGTPNVYRWYYDINKVSLQLGIWVPETFSNLIFYNPQQGEPQITSFNLNPIGSESVQQIKVKNVGTTSGNFVLTLAPESGVAVSSDTFTLRLAAGEERVINFGTFKLADAQRECITAKLTSFSKVAQATSCAMTSNEDDPVIPGASSAYQAGTGGLKCEEGMHLDVVYDEQRGILGDETRTAKLQCVPDEPEIDYTIVGAVAVVIALIIGGAVYLSKKR